jgi:arsenite methyltransferase
VSEVSEEMKACCASAYSGHAARWLLGDSFHPGGGALTSELVRSLGVGPGALVVDVASGLGTSALQAAEETGCDVVGIDLAPKSVETAAARAEALGLAGRVRFRVGDAEALPLADASADGALCECSLCLFPDKPAAVRELVRVLRPGARLALSDVVADAERLPPELRGLAAWAACLADARPLEEVVALLADAGFAVERAERRDRALAGLVARVGARLRAAQLLGELVPAALAERIPAALAIAEAALRALDEGTLGYAVVVAAR